MMDTSIANRIADYHTRASDNATTTRRDGSDSAGIFGADGLGFDDLIDAVNPLQHLPIVGTLYRAISGDEITPGARIAGGGIFGGGIGALFAMADEMFAGLNGGEHLGETILSAFNGSSAAPDSPAPPAIDLAAMMAVRAATRGFPTDTMVMPVLGDPLGRDRAMVAPERNSIPRLSPAAFDTLMARFGDAGTATRANDARTAYASALETMRANLMRMPDAHDETAP